MGRLLSRGDRHILFVGGVLALVILWLYTAFIITPLMQEASNAGQQVRTAREELAMLERATANEAMLRQQHREAEGTVQSLRQLLPPEHELPAAIEFLSDLASQSNVKIQTIFPQRREEQGASPTSDAGRGEIYRGISIQIEALAGYHQVGTFVSLVESSKRPMRLLSLRISSNPKDLRWHSVTLLIAAYFAITEEAGST